MRNNLICWQENDIKKWNMIKNADTNTFLLELMKNKNVDKHTIFIIPTTGGFVQGIWLFPDTHKSKRVDFYNFYDDFGIIYEKPKADEETKKIIEKVDKKKTKYGWISPQGKYFHCDYQGHTNLADRICFGMVETTNAERYLEENGWCKIYKSLFKEQYSVYIGGKHVITDDQIKTLIEMGLDNAGGISDVLCKGEKNDGKY